MNTILTIGRHTNAYTSTMHTHQHFELLYCIEAGGFIALQDRQQNYQKGDLIVIKPAVPHYNCPAPGFSDIYLTIDQLPFAMEDVLIIPDNATGVFFQCLKQIHHFDTTDVFNKDSIMVNFGELLTNLMLALSSFERHSLIIERFKANIVKGFCDSAFNLNDLFEQVDNYNANYLKKLFKKEIGMSPQQFLINLRLTHAKNLLHNHNHQGGLSVSQIAYHCGYDDPLYFSRAFKARYGHSPKAYFQDAQTTANGEPSGQSPNPHLGE